MNDKAFIAAQEKDFQGKRHKEVSISLYYFSLFSSFASECV